MSHQKEDVWFVIPAYNEQKNIERVVTDLRKEGYFNIIVINDCSTDKTGEVIDKLPVKALHHKVNKGQGAALRTGVNYFLEQTKGKFVVHFDSDGQHRVADIAAMLLPLSQGYDVTTGSRFLTAKGKNNMPFGKRFVVLPIARIVNFMLFGIRASDAHNGFRAFTRKGAEECTFRLPRMEHATEISYVIAKKRLRHTEVPVVIDYHDFGQGFLQGVGIFWRLLQMRLRYRV